MSGATSEVEDTKNDDIQKYDVGKRKGSVVFLLDSSATKTQSAQSTNPELNENEDSSALPSDSKQSTDECNSGSSTATKGRCKEVPVVIISEAGKSLTAAYYKNFFNRKKYCEYEIRYIT